MSDLERIENFIAKHHVLSLASVDEKRGVWVCSVFYAYDLQTQSFLFASKEDSTHIQNSLKEPKIAANIHLETKTLGKIEGLQISGTFSTAISKRQRDLYFQTFPYAKAMSPKLYALVVQSFKYTNNKLGFGKKIIWTRTSA